MGASTVLTCYQVTSTTVAAALASLLCGEVAVQNDPGNSVAVLVGNGTNQLLSLSPGDTIVLAISNANLLYHKATSSTAVLNVIVRN